MADQRKNAGNIGDIVKHTFLSHLVMSYGDSQQGNWEYRETHAGYYDYPLKMLKDGTSWKGERAWSVGVLESSGKLKTLGGYGKELEKSLESGVYPGSIRIVGSLNDPARPSRIVGWDIGEEQVQSFKGRSESITVCKADGYCSAESLTDKGKLVFCDPFWTASDETTKVRNLIKREAAVIVWYPLSNSTESFRKWLVQEPYPTIECWFRHYVPGKNGWAGQNMKGAGLLVKGLSPAALFGAGKLAYRLKAIFENRRHAGKPRKVRDGSIVIPQDRHLDLRFEISI